MQYPVFLTTAEAAEILRIGKTSLYARINDGSLQTAKMGRSTKITFSSVIEYAMRCLRDGNSAAKFPENFRNVDDVPSSVMAEHLVRQLSYIHTTPDDISGEHHSPCDSRNLQLFIGEFPKNNFGGEA